MRLNNKGLRLIYFSNLKENEPDTRKECPHPKLILRIVRGKKTDKIKNRVIDHITDCYHCASEFEFILKAIRLESDIENTVQKFIEIKNRKGFSPRNSWRIASLVSGAVLLCIILLFIIIPNHSRIIKYRNSSFPQINLILPQKKIIHNTMFYFRWEKVKDSEYYIIDLFDETLFQIWSSEKIFQNQYKMPHEMSSQLATNKTYFWMVSAVFKSGKIVESPLKELLVTN